MEFLLIFDWIDEDNSTIQVQRVEFYGTKEELLEAKKKAEEKYSFQISVGRLILSPAISYSWKEFEQLF